MRQSLTLAQAQSIAAAICGLGGEYSDSQFVDLLYDLAALPPVTAEEQVNAIVAYLSSLHVDEPVTIVTCDLFSEGNRSNA